MLNKELEDKFRNPVWRPPGQKKYTLEEEMAGRYGLRTKPVKKGKK